MVYFFLLRRFLGRSKWLMRFFLIWCCWLISFNALSLLFPLPLDKIEEGFSRAVTFDDGSINYVALSSRETLRLFTPPDKIGEKIKACFIGYEDRLFYAHPGVNPFALARAAFQYLMYGRVVSGGSTLTMQVARMIEPKERNLLSKIQEIFRALQLEVRYSKDEIFHIYLNMIPMGGNLEGIGSGSYYYFNKNPDALSIGETALLIGIPQSPNFSRPDKNWKGAAATRNKVLARLFENGTITSKEFDSAIKTKSLQSRTIPPFVAPHLTMKLLKENKDSPLISMTINRTKQMMCERIINSIKEEYRLKGIKNCGILVVNNRTRKIETWIGNFDYFNRDEFMIDCVSIKRSPGSTLKPFIYAKSIDAGLITPQFVLYDVKRYYAGYKVENYDKKYHGPVTATEALVRSFNSPAVYLLQQLNKGALYPLLDSLGYEVEAGEDLGLSVALGAKEISLFDLVKNYTAFSHRGRVVNIHYTDVHRDYKGVPLISGEAAYLVSDMLSQGARLDLPRSWEFARGKGRVAWKTGTSYGNYDALCVGYNGDYTIGVWVGNADRSYSKELLGTRAAAPILFKIFNALTLDEQNWLTQPLTIKKRKISAESGMIPSSISPHIITDYYIPGISSMSTCNRFKKVFVDKNSGYAVINTMGRQAEELVWEVYPPEAMPWVRKNLHDYKPPPPIDPAELKYVKNSEKLRILSPLIGKVYYLNRYLPLETQKIPLLVESFSDTTELYWFLNGRLLENGPANNSFFLTPQAGKYTLMCLDNQGRSASLEITIEVIG